MPDSRPTTDNGDPWEISGVDSGTIAVKHDIGWRGETVEVFLTREDLEAMLVALPPARA